MKLLRLEIKRCGECRHIAHGLGFYCTHPDVRLVKHDHNFVAPQDKPPSWCPLPEAEPDAAREALAACIAELRIAGYSDVRFLATANHAETVLGKARTP